MKQRDRDDAKRAIGDGLSLLESQLPELGISVEAHRFPPTKLPAREFPAQTGLRNPLPGNLLRLRTKDANIISLALQEWAKL